MTTTLFHGSDAIVASPEYGKGKPVNDYGRGFYCTENKELAKVHMADYVGRFCGAKRPRCGASGRSHNGS